MWWKSKIILQQYRQFHCIHKNKCFYKDTVKDVETRFYTSTYELSITLPKEKNKKVIDVMEDELNDKIIKKALD